MFVSHYMMHLKPNIRKCFNEMVDKTASWQNGVAPMKLINPVINKCI